MAAERPRLFDDLDPVPVSEVAAIVGDGSAVERRDGPKPDTRPSARAARRRQRRAGRGAAPKKAPKKVQGSKCRPSDMQWLEAVACFKPLWELALQVQTLMDGTPPRRRAGRVRGYGAFEVMLFEVAAWRFMSYQRAADNFADARVWNMLRSAAAAAFPDDPRMRLSETPTSRSQHYRFRKRYLTEHLLDVMHDTIDRAAVKAALSMGLFAPGLGSLTDPDPRSFVSADGCWIPALTRLTRRDAVDADTGEITRRRFDPDALAYHTNDGARARSPGHLWVMVQARNPWANERVILTARHKSAKNPHMPRNDATSAVDAILDLAEKHPRLRAGLRGVVYDMALSVADFDRLLDAGLIPVSKVPLTNKGRVAVENLGPHTLRTTNGAPAHQIVYAVNGTPCIIATDGDGIDHYLPLRLIQVKQHPRRKRPLTATRWAVPGHPLAPAGLKGATTRVRHTRTAAERNAGKSFSRALRIFPEPDHRFRSVFGLREDSESANSDLKNRLWNRRCRTLGHNSVELNLISYQAHTLITALLAFHNRTGADTTAWFGKHETPRQQPHLALAA